uniref:Uncharacterized protein n=1 Tax=Rhodosorus marinus TaxID=101924 RepID=A0A7S0BGU5_9RHOD|mmetsp:Transcript_15793/g.23113  ORF Transcript_15793/g.23113 Transcript_15793/m.23113 type:complete len:114 (+) Transcript_15793:113-454(+)
MSFSDNPMVTMLPCGGYSRTLRIGRRVLTFSSIKQTEEPPFGVTGLVQVAGGVGSGGWWEGVCAIDRPPLFATLANVMERNGNPEDPLQCQTLHARCSLNEDQLSFALDDDLG